MKRRRFLDIAALSAAGTALPVYSAKGEKKRTDTIHEPAKEVEVIDSADIVILGGGSAGCAAVAAAPATVTLRNGQVYRMKTGCGDLIDFGSGVIILEPQLFILTVRVELSLHVQLFACLNSTAFLPNSIGVIYLQWSIDQP